MNVVEDIKNKNDKISNEMSQLRQENAALWGEMNSLRVKYSKQTKIINKLIHFLITYMQKHHNSRKSGRTVSSDNSNKYLKTGPKIMELDYKYKNNPHEFWSDFDSKNSPTSEHQNYTVIEPGEDQMEIGEYFFLYQLNIIIYFINLSDLMSSFLHYFPLLLNALILEYSIYHLSIFYCHINHTQNYIICIND